jgi:hypothetical protein
LEHPHFRLRINAFTSVKRNRVGKAEIGLHIGDVETGAHGSAYQRDSKQDRLRGSLMALHGRKA